jgi:hypothetical protein
MLPNVCSFLIATLTVPTGYFEHCRSSSARRFVAGCLSGGVYKAEDVIQNVPAAGFALELECLSVAHRLLLSVDLRLCKHMCWEDLLKESFEPAEHR